MAHTLYNLGKMLKIAQDKRAAKAQLLLYVNPTKVVKIRKRKKVNKKLKRSSSLDDSMNLIARGDCLQPTDSIIEK